MYAIIKDGNRQHKVEVQKRIQIDYRDGVEKGDSLEFAEVLAVSDNDDVHIGVPTVAGAKVVAKVLEPKFKGPKLVVAQFRRRKNSKRKTGHRQVYTVIEVQEIVV
jgi:large subunit ribosomal protein L21